MGPAPISVLECVGDVRTGKTDEARDSRRALPVQGQADRVSRGWGEIMKGRHVVYFVLLVSAMAAGGASLGAEAPTSPAGQAVVRIHYSAGEDLAILARELDVWEVRRDERVLVAAVDPGQYLRLLSLGYRVEIDEALTARLDAPLEPLPGQVSGVPGYPCYRTVEETFASLSGLEAAFPELAEWVDIGDSWEKVQAGGAPGYDLWVLVLTNEARPGPKPRLFLMSEIHARELATAEIAARFAEYLIAGYGSDPEATWLLDFNEIHILAMTNPDGRKIAETGLYQRKNTNNTNGGSCAVPPTSSNHFGTDLNRNSSFLWGGAATNPCDATYQGPVPASEPETQGVQDYVLTLFPDQRGPGLGDAAPPESTGLFLTLHSYSQLVLWPWGHTYDSAPNDAQLSTLGRKFAYYNQYTPQQSSDLYPTTGATDDWAYGELGVAAYTFEVGTAFFQDCGSFESTIWPRNRDAILYGFKAARRPYLDPAGPESRAVALGTPGVVAGGAATVSATADDTRHVGGGSALPIAAARAGVAVPSWLGGTTTALSAVDGAFDETVEQVIGEVSAAGLPPGRHVVFVESQDSGGSWGVAGAGLLCVAATEHGVGVSPASDTRWGTPGGAVSYTLRVTNSGAVAETVSVQLSGNAWPSSAAQSIGPVAPCSFSDLTVTVALPSGLAAGASDSLQVTLTAQGASSVTSSATLTTRVAAGVAVTPAGDPTTTEAGGAAQFTFELTAVPAAPVVFSLSSSDPGEGSVSPASLTFAPDSWNQPQVVTVTGVDDTAVDGDRAYAVVTGAAESGDPFFSGLAVPDLDVVNLDDDVAGFAISPAGSLTTTETGGRATFTIRLTSEPSSSVAIALSTSDSSEGTVSPQSLTFGPTNWNTPRTVTATGVNDGLVDGPIAYAILTALATSTDPIYSGLNPPDVPVTNLDDESADLSVAAADSPDPVPVGTPFTVVVEVANNGMLTSTTTTLTLSIAASATLSELSSTRGSCSGTTCQLGEMAMGASAAVTAEIVPGALGSVVTTASVTTDKADPKASNNSASVITAAVAFGAVGLAVDTVPPVSGSSNLNGVLEAGETVTLSPGWRNFTAAPLALTSTGGLFTGNASTSYVYVDSTADYGTIGAGQVGSCLDGGPNCLTVKITPPASRPEHFDATLVERLSDGSARTWTLHVGGSFADVAPEFWAYRFVETLLHSGITSGCGGGRFCPGTSVSRWQMAVFLAKGMTDGTAIPLSGTVPGLGDYDCRAGGTSVFGDVPPEDPGCRFIHHLAVEGVTAGCGAGL